MHVKTRSHPISKLIIKDCHEKGAHIGREDTLALMRRKICIPSSRGLIRKVLFDCLYCKRERIKPQKTLMSELPKERLEAYGKPFYKTGIDFFGPIIVKLSKKTRAYQGKAKRYGVIFTCMTTRAIHLEIAGDLITNSFILSLRHFIARRGNVKHIRSDNRTNFKGAQKELQEAIAETNIPKVISELVKKHVNFIWTFNPPSSPWMGGAWEALIKSVKRTLKAITCDRLFTEEALHTFICEVESILNNRPITPSSNYINDYEALTPSHILFGHSSSNYAPGVFREDEINYRKKMACGSSSNQHVLESLAQGIFTNARSERKMELPITKLKRWRSCRYPNRQYTQVTLALGSYNRDISRSR